MILPVQPVFLGEPSIDNYTGREDLMNSVFNYIIEEQLIRLNDILAKYPGTKDRLREFLYLDIESGSQYMVFCQLRKTKYVEFEEENENFKELYAIYMALFKQPIENGQIRKELSASWLETFYMLMVETSLRSMEEGEDKEECFQMAWSCFWNGIKSDSK